MSLKAKLEAVIYAAEEPVTLTQLAALFAGDALQWRAAQEAAAAEQAAEVAGTNPADPLPLLAEGLEYLGLEDSPPEDSAPEDSTQMDAASDAPPTQQHAGPPQTDLHQEKPTRHDSTPDDSAQAYPVSEITAHEPSASQAPADPDTEARRLSRLRDREIKGVIKQLLDELIAEYTSDDRGVEIREIAGGYRIATKPECHDAVRMFVKSLKPPMKLSLPALETLAVVAYKQPVTSPEVSEIRGVESGGVLGSLLARKLIATAGRKQVIGRPILYKTTKEFLLRFGLKDLAELPSMEEFEKMATAEIEELEPEVVAADAAQSAAELRENSPSGEEMADPEASLEAGLEEDLEAKPVPVIEAGPEIPAPAQDSAKAASPESSATSNQEEPAADTPAEIVGTQPETSTVGDVLPAEPNEEIEAVSHAQEVEEKR